MKLSLGEKLAYGLGDTASNLVFGTVVSFLMFYYTDIFGLTAAAAGTLFLVVRVVDGFVDFFMGAVADQTVTRWGRFRPWLVWMAAPFAIITVLTFTVPEWGAPAKLAYAWATYVALMLVYSAINIPYSALSGVLTSDPHERLEVAGVRMACAQVGALIVSIGTLPAIAFFSGPAGNRALGYQRTMTVFGAAAAVMFLSAFLGTRERIAPPPGQRWQLRDAVRSLAGNRPWLVLFAAGIVLFTFGVLRQGMAIYYFKYRVGSESVTSAFFTFGCAGTFVGALAAPLLARRFGNRAAWCAGALGTSICMASYWVLPPGAVAAMLALNALAGLGTGINASLLWALLGEAADYAEWRQGRRRTGLVFSAAACSHKIGMGFGSALGGELLGAFGYAPGAVQSPAVLTCIVLLMSVVPAVGFVALAAIVRFYPLDDPERAQMHEELHRRRVAVAPAA